MRRLALFGSLAFSLAISGYACSSGGGGTGGHGAGGSHSGTGGTGASTQTGMGGGFSSHGDVVSLVVTPPMATIDVQNGVAAPAQFTATATFTDGTTGPVDAAWSFDRIDLALPDQVGHVSANGTLGGHGTLTASVNGKSGTAAVDVILHVVTNTANLSTTDQGLFNSPDANPSGTLLYPYDKTVFARGLLAPELQWSGGASGAAYLVHLSEPFYDAKIYVNADPPSRFLLPADVWTQLTDSNAGGPATLDIQRLSGGQAHQAMHESWTIAQGSLRGSIYYWAVNTGQLMKIAPGTASPTVVFDSGPADQLGTPAPAAYNGATPPWESGGNNKRCVACHTVSKDGSTAAAIFEKKGSTASPWGSIDLTVPQPNVTQMAPYSSSAIYLGLSPEGKYAVHNDVDLTMHLADAKTGAAIPSALDAFADKVADPAFSPDGTKLAFSSNVSGAYPVEFFRADLDVILFDPANAAFSTRTNIASGGSEAIAFPSFSPDSNWILFQMGDYSRAKYGTSSVGKDDLFIADIAKQVGVLPLALASGAGLEAKNQHISYQPTVNPIAVGGYIWVVFVSPRDYGNEMASTSNPTYENRKQLWVAAIDANPQPGQDPSHPAFWLPGQDLTTTNMSGYWALEACHQVGTSCDQGFECCTGFCQPDGMGSFACVPPPGGCSHVGDKCSGDGDCCNAPQNKCIGGFCAQAVPN